MLLSLVSVDVAAMRACFILLLIYEQSCIINNKCSLDVFVAYTVSKFISHAL